MDKVSDVFLQVLRDKKYSVNVYLTSGIKLTGIIREFDDIAVVMSGQTIQLIYKHSISTVQQDNR